MQTLITKGQWNLIREYTDYSRIMKSLPKRPPAPFDKVLDGGNRVGGDLMRVYQRYWMAVYLVGRWMLCASMEIEDVIGKMDDVSSKSGSLKRIINDLVGWLT